MCSWNFLTYSDSFRTGGLFCSVDSEQWFHRIRGIFPKCHLHREYKIQKFHAMSFADLVRRNTGSFNINKCVPLRMAQWMPPTKIFGEYIVSLASAGTWHKNGACQIVVNVSPCYALIMMILYSFTFFYSIEPSFCVGVRALTAACEGTQWRGTDRNTTRLCHIKHSAACDQAACSLPLSSTDWNYTHRRAECMTTNVIV